MPSRITSRLAPRRTSVEKRKSIPATVQPHNDLKSSGPSTVAALSSPKKEGFQYSESPRHASRAREGATFASFSPWDASESRYISSTVIIDPKDWCDESLLIPHEALRLDISRAEKALESLTPDETADWKLENFFTWYREYHHPNVHHHHDAEENIYFPFIATRCKLPPKLAADHKELLDQMDKIDALYKHATHGGPELDAAARERIVTALKKEWTVYRELMFPHLAEEEEHIPAALRANFTIEEEAEAVNKIIESLGLAGNKTFLPIILDAMTRWGGERKVAEFRSNIPPPILLLLDYFWTPDYEKRQRLLVDSLTMDEDPFAPQPSSLAFGFCFAGGV